MDDSPGIIDAKYDHLTRTGVKAHVMFGLFIVALAVVVGGVLYVTASTTEWAANLMGVGQ